MESLGNIFAHEVECNYITEQFGRRPLAKCNIGPCNISQKCLAVVVGDQYCDQLIFGVLFASHQGMQRHQKG